MQSVILTREEIDALTGYQWPSKQLAELKRQGFYRARFGPAGNVLLERAHYEAVCAGPRAEANRPHVRPVLRKIA